MRRETLAWDKGATMVVDRRQVVKSESEYDPRDPKVLIVIERVSI